MQLLSVPEVAERLGISQTTVYRLLESNELEYINIGKRLYKISEEAIADFLQRRTNKPNGS